MTRLEIHQVIEPFINAPVECDGFVRLAHTALVAAGVDHTVMHGRLVSADSTRRTPIHFWITLANGDVIDYRAQMWLGSANDVPSGIFAPAEFPGWSYQGSVIDIPTLHPAVAEMLTRSIPSAPMRNPIDGP